MKQKFRQLIESLPKDLYGVNGANPLIDLIREIEEGKSTIIWQDNKPIRQVRHLWVRVFPHPDSEFTGELLELESATHCCLTGRIDEVRQPAWGLSKYLNYNQDPPLAALDLLQFYLNINSSVDLTDKCVQTVEPTPPIYPGLLTDYKQFNYSCILPLTECYPNYSFVELSGKRVWQWATSI